MKTIKNEPEKDNAQAYEIYLLKKSKCYGRTTYTTIAPSVSRCQTKKIVGGK